MIITKKTLLFQKPNSEPLGLSALATKLCLGKFSVSVTNTINRSGGKTKYSKQLVTTDLTDCNVCCIVSSVDKSFETKIVTTNFFSFKIFKDNSYFICFCFLVLIHVGPWFCNFQTHLFCLFLIKCQQYSLRGRGQTTNTRSP